MKSLEEELTNLEALRNLVLAVSEGKKNKHGLHLLRINHPCIMGDLDAFKHWVCDYLGKRIKSLEIQKHQDNQHPGWTLTTSGEEK